MCGFVGFLDSNLEADKNIVIKDMLDTIIHRGPNSFAIYKDASAALGLRMLDIANFPKGETDLIYNEDKSHALLFDGRIYNYDQLKDELTRKGHIFKTNTDSEVVVHGYEEYGVDILYKLRGMFAFAIWDIKDESMFLAKDIFGVKPLYYTQNTLDKSFIFGSEIKAFLKQPSFIKELNKDALRPYLTFEYSVLDETFFKGVYKLKPGHFMIYKKGSVEVKSYWKPDFDKKENNFDFYVENIKQLMKESVDSYKASDVEVGSFLSGGIDSSYIVALARPQKTFSVGFYDYEAMFNETNLAKDLCDILNIGNYKKIINAQECFEMLPTIQYYMDQPQSNPSAVPLYFLAELAKDHVDLVLSGEGADELFAGYPWYQPSKNLEKYEKIPYFARRLISTAAKRLPKNKTTNFLIKGGQKVEEKFIGHAKVFEEDDALEILKTDYKRAPSVQDVTKKIFDEVKDKDDLSKMQYLDYYLWMPGDILLKADRMSMAHSLEVRMPFLDKEIARLSSQIPGNFLVNDLNTKYVLRAAAKETLPDEWAKRPKLGFPVPIRYWLREEEYYNMVKEMFKSDFTHEFFHVDKLMEYLDRHYRGEGSHARYIWTVYVFLIWYKKFFIEM